MQGALKRIPITGALWIAGFFAILGAPPFGAFTSELAILRAAVTSGSWAVVVLYSLLLAAVFAGMIGVLVKMAQGARAAEPVSAVGLVRVAKGSSREPAFAVAAPLVLLAITGGLGIVVPGFLSRTLQQAALLLGV